jgi:NTP pyrophosphatase (non-canonical NTP hydrolase)
MLSIKELQREHWTWLQHNFPAQKEHQPLLGIGEEVGELMHAHLKAEQHIRGESGVENYLKKGDALGDIFIYMLSYANTNQIDLEAAIDRAWAQVKKRDWIKYPKNGVNQ